jgi:hypothetical protein
METIQRLRCKKQRFLDFARNDIDRQGLPKLTARNTLR